MDEREKKTLELFVILISTCYSFLETDEAKREFALVLRRMREKIMKEVGLNE